MITTSGLSALRRYFAGYDSNLADTISIGIGNTAGQAMQCEWARLPIANVGTDVDNGYVIFKTSSPISAVGKIYEVGLVQGAGGMMRDVILTTFRAEEESWIGGAFTTTNARLGDGLKIAANSNAYANLNPTSIAGTSDKDFIVLAGFASAAGTVALTLEFLNGSSANVTLNVTNGYGFATASRSAMTKTGPVDWQTITKVTLKPSIEYTADLLKLQVANPVGETLVARTILTAPYTTDATLPLEIEYPLGVRIDS